MIGQPEPLGPQGLPVPTGSDAAQNNRIVPDMTAIRTAMQAMGDDPKYDILELAERTGLSVEKVQDYWTWLGIPIKHLDGPLFTDFDVEALSDLNKIVQSEQLEDATIASLVRSVGHNAARMAYWQFESLVENTTQRLKIDDAAARRIVVQRFPQIAKEMDKQAKHAYLVAATRVIQENSEPELVPTRPKRNNDNLPAPRVVGFADIVGFTKRTASMEPGRLTAYIRDYEARTRDIVIGGGGRVVKMIGDAVLFLADSLESGVTIALALAEPKSNANAETPMRVGMVWGQVVQRFGDVFGSRVNLAARLTDIAAPNTLYVDPSTAALLVGHKEYQLSVMPEAQIQGLGSMRPVKVSSISPPDAVDEAIISTGAPIAENTLPNAAPTAAQS